MWTSARSCVLLVRRQGNLLDRVRARVAVTVSVKVAVSGQEVGFRRLPVTMTVPPWEKPALMVRWLALAEMVTVAIAVGAVAPAGRAARVTQEIQITRVTLARASASADRQPTMQAVAKGTPKCQGKDRAQGATGPGLTVALQMTVGTVRAQMRSPTP